MEKTILTQEELSNIQSMNNDFTKAKMALGDLELQKYNLLKTVELLKSDFAKHEMDLIAKYGKDSVINVQTGEVTKKEE